MLNRIRPRLSYANVISSIALFSVLGGGAYAAHTHRIGTNDVENRAITRAKLDRHAVGGPKVGTDAIGKRMLRQGAVGRAEVRRRAIATGKLADEAVTRRKLADGTVTMSKLGAELVDLLERLELQDLLRVTPVASETVPGEVSSTAPIGDFEALGGPSVQVTVPSSGLIEVWAQVEIEEENGGAVALFEDGEPVSGIAEEQLCGDEAVLIDFQGTENGDDFLTVSSPPDANFVVGCGGTGAPSPVILRRPPGSHTYELRYSDTSCPCADEATFRNRVLRVGARL